MEALSPPLLSFYMLKMMCHNQKFYIQIYLYLPYVERFSMSSCGLKHTDFLFGKVSKNSA